MKGKAKRVVLPVTNDVVNDRRVEKMCFSLKELGWNPVVVGRVLSGSKSVSKPFEVKRFKLFFNQGFLFYAEYNLRLFFWLLFQSFAVIQANDLDTLLPSFLVSRIRRKKLVYDSHEYFTEVPEIQHRPLVKSVWLALEEWIFPKLKFAITVNESIAEAYRNKYRVAVQIVRNVPLVNDLSNEVVPENFENKFVVLMQGAGINVDRGAEELVLSSDYLSDDFLILIIGAGDAWSKLQELVKGREGKVKLISRLPYEKLMAYTKGANIGVSLDKPTNLNYLYSLPNKLFDYCMAGLPVLGSKVIEVERVIKNNNVGWVIEEVSAMEIAKKLTEIRKNVEEFEEKREQALKLHQKYNWKREVQPLQEIYRSFAD